MSVQAPPTGQPGQRRQLTIGDVYRGDSVEDLFPPEVSASMLCGSLVISERDDSDNNAWMQSSAFVEVEQ